MKEQLRIAIIGLGNRGRTMLKHEMVHMAKEDLRIVGLCDVYEDRNQLALEIMRKFDLPDPEQITTDYKKILKMDLDAVLIFTSWENHVNIACEAMEAGIYCGVEVAGAYSIEDCWKLIRTYERTKTPLMMLENCSYGKRELMVLEMVRKGLFGDVVHCSGSYAHDLRKEIALGEENRHYRLQNYLIRNCENYPTHELLPIGRILNINFGNRFVSLTSTASSAKGLARWVEENLPEDHKLQGAEFKQGDIVTTVLKCAGGESVTITLDTSLPRAYSRGFTVRGTKGAYFEDNDSVFLDDVHHKDYEFDGKPLWGNAAEYEKEYEHPLWQNYDGYGTHDGTDHLVLRAFFESVKAGIEPPIDVYDAATYMAVTALSEQSIREGSAPQAFPDFTGGHWITRKLPKNKYNI